jgi:hypothetical protein
MSLYVSCLTTVPLGNLTSILPIGGGDDSHPIVRMREMVSSGRREKGSYVMGIANVGQMPMKVQSKMAVSGVSCSYSYFPELGL